MQNRRSNASAFKNRYGGDQQHFFTCIREYGADLTCFVTGVEGMNFLPRTAIFFVVLRKPETERVYRHDMYDPNFLIKLVQARMPFGKYNDWYITDLPVYYLEWFHRKGFPEGQLGQYLATMYEIKTNGLDDILKPIKKEHRRYSGGS